MKAGVIVIPARKIFVVHC